ncbi:hypothetical protein ILYODFUR_031532 [Ilyodon furcidens]|uniref:Uncharacterized protein n=1 Tax=Ilyodon furcidens TaxID=33524 RepID=A0ABV0TZC2_9TELE
MSSGVTPALQKTWASAAGTACSALFCKVLWCYESHPVYYSDEPQGTCRSQCLYLGCAMVAVEDVGTCGYLPPAPWFFQYLSESSSTCISPQGPFSQFSILPFIPICDKASYCQVIRDRVVQFYLIQPISVMEQTQEHHAFGKGSLLNNH